MGRMKELYTAIQEAQQALGAQQLFPPEGEERHAVHGAIFALLNPPRRTRVLPPHEDQQTLLP
jgi:hypothetical protein